MSFRFIVYHVDRAGDPVDVCSFPTLPEALRHRDKLRERFGGRGRHYGVRDREEPEDGDLDWPEPGRARRQRGGPTRRRPGGVVPRA